MARNPRQKNLFGIMLRGFIGIAALGVYFMKVSGGDPISKWLMVCMLGVLLIFWSCLDLYNTYKPTPPPQQGKKKSAKKAAPAKSAKSNKGGKRK